MYDKFRLFWIGSLQSFLVCGHVSGLSTISLPYLMNLRLGISWNLKWEAVVCTSRRESDRCGVCVGSEFVTSVRGIRILSPSEVFFYMNEERFGAAHNTLNPGSLKQY